LRKRDPGSRKPGESILNFLAREQEEISDGMLNNQPSTIRDESEVERTLR
jgi:hypothetical protein